ncbi:MAG: hypothetical protein MRY63_03055 [Neomegalonema sp.]|nr:hypothetical protein [Neomegalonema sp.]
MSGGPQEQILATAQAFARADLAYLSPLGPMILAAAALGLALDTRSFARGFEVAHALVIRECNSLSCELGLLALEEQGPQRSQRIFYRLTEKARGLLPPRLEP